MGKNRKIFLILAQRLLITFELFNRNGLMNHAAACAYGFLLSAAPALLFIAFIVLSSLSASPELAEGLLLQIGNFFSVFNVSGIVSNFLNSSNSGLAGFISIIMLFWTARLCVLSAQRGLGVIFPGPRSVIRDNAVMLGLGFLAMLIIFTIMLGSFLVKSFFNSSVLNTSAAIPLFTRFFSFFSIALLAFAAYRLVPAKPPKIKYIISGVLTCVILFQIFSEAFTLLINPNRYNLIYGTLGRLFLFLIKVYFFFAFFFFGAQMIHVLENSDALLFSRFRQFNSKRIPSKALAEKLFAVLPESLKKYSGFYKEGEFVFTKGSSGREAYYILSGKAGVYLDQKCRNRIAFIDEKHFFGEMAYISPEEKRAASIKAETELSVLVLPPSLFRDILKFDPDTDRNIIRALSKRLKSVNEQIVTE
jgi:membrane protein